MSQIKVAVAGAAGRMGRMLIDAALADEEVQLVSAFERAGSPLAGRDAAEFSGVESGVMIVDDARQAIAVADCIIDFTRPEATCANLLLARELGKSIVIGTTGLSAEDKRLVAEVAESVPVVFAPNMAVGVNAVFRLLEVAARILNEGYDIEVIEAHHRFKVDAPSGTALRMGEIVARELGRNLDECAIYGREGVTGERDAETIGFSTIRGGDIVGDHTVLFAGLGERIEITHKSASRMPYAVGAMRAARFLRDHSSGLFDMQDVLGLKA